MASPLDRAAERGLRWSRSFWFVVAAAGQLLFVAFIVAYYYSRTLGGSWASWNEKPLIEGYQANDLIGNLMFAGHVLLAAVMTTGGVLQLVPDLRAKWPRMHRINGRLFVGTAASLAIGGLHLVWVRGTYINLVGAIAISLDAVLILAFAVQTVRAAVSRRFDSHRRWALRTFMVANGVWMMRVGYMAWGITTGGWGVGERMDGPFDAFLAFGCYLVPLGLLEAYLWVESRGKPLSKLAFAVSLGVATILLAVGAFGAAAFMWWPYL